MQAPRNGDAAHHVTEECERLFCETLRTAFLVEKNGGAARNSLVMGAPDYDRTDESAVDDGKMSSYAEYGAAGAMPVQSPHAQQHQHQHRRPRQASLPTPAPSPGTTTVYPHAQQTAGMIKEYLEVYDYHAAGTRFRGFVAEKEGGERALFVFFDREVMGQDLKPG